MTLSGLSPGTYACASILRSRLFCLRASSRRLHSRRCRRRPRPLQRRRPIVTPAALETPAGPQLNRADLDAWLDGFIPYAIAKGNIAGGVVVVVKDGQVLLEKGFGYADVEKRTPVDPETTLFRPGSISKLFTWTAVMQLVEQGKIDLDADVNQYLDIKIPPGPDGEPIRMRDVMTHTAGFEEAVKELISEDPSTHRSARRYRQALGPDPNLHGGQDAGLLELRDRLAGYIVERVSGQTFDDYLDTTSSPRWEWLTPRFGSRCRSRSWPAWRRATRTPPASRKAMS